MACPIVRAPPPTPPFACSARTSSCALGVPVRRCSFGRRGVVADASLKEAVLVPVKAEGAAAQLPSAPGVYAVFDEAGSVQYVGLTRQVSTSVANHLRDLPELTAAVKFDVIASGAREELTAAWKGWVEEAIHEIGGIPPGNAPGETKWQGRGVRVKPEIRLTAGKAITVPIDTLIDQVVKGNKVVAFVKGTRTQPQCGFSHKMLTLLNDIKVEYEVVNVLDDFHNPGLREAIKVYSQWPTIPQLYINGDFVGGADIVEEMAGSGQLAEALAAKS